jgi:raffinose/stachyose/melibiose transport system permease protein
VIESRIRNIGNRRTAFARRFLLNFFMVIISAALLLPIFTVINFSFKTKKELYLDSALALPHSLYLDNYISALDRLKVGTTFVNTFVYTTLSVFFLAVLSGSAAWAIARNRGRFYRFTYLYFLLGILIPFQALFLPIYIVGNAFHLTNTFYGIILMYIATGLSFSIFLMTSFMSQVPVELEEAAQMDGASIYRTYFRIVLPLLKPAIATLVILQAFAIWNDYLLASLFVSRSSLKTLNVLFQQLFSTTSSNYSTAMAGVMISVVPISILFVALQRYFIKGLTAGAVKG